MLYTYIYNNNNIRICKMIVGERIIFADTKERVETFREKN